MTPLELGLRPSAVRDLDRRVEYLELLRGAAFAQDWSNRFLDWLVRTAENGAVIGTTHPTRPGFRTFPYRNQATVIAEFTETELRIVRVYFAGQDWMT